MNKKLEPEVADALIRIGNQIKLLRKDRTNFHYKDLAEELSIGQNTYLRIEQGKYNYQIGNLISILKYYPDVKLSDLFRDAGL
ncbi:MAG: helix-turn-helix domain-containing protein [Bacteroidales bacterium]|nr:helix-turn-helix domain-containing protein [Bacteroidales bacterium]